MEEVAWYIKWGAIFGFVSTILLILFHIPPIFKGLYSIFRWLIKLIKNLPSIKMKIMNAYKWKKVQPSWEIVKPGKVIVKPNLVQGRKYYDIELPVRVKYVNKSNRVEIQLDKCSRYASIQHPKDEIDSSYNLQLKSITGSESLGAGDKNNIIDYVFATTLKIPPNFKKQERCKLVFKLNGFVYTGQTYLYGSYKRTGKCNVLVEIGEWEDIEV